jgi:hypothetical protein
MTARTPLKQIRLRHREFVGNVSGSTTFATSGLFVNPGLDVSCPWLSILAGAFETYRWNKLSFHYVPSCATSTAGAIFIAPDYDPSDDNTHLTKGDFLSFQDAVRAPPWQAVECMCTPSNLHNRKTHYVRHSGDVGEIRTFDALRLWFGKETPAVDTTIGELWIEYDVTLFTPQKQTDNDFSSIGITRDETTVDEDTPVGHILPSAIKEYHHSSAESEYLQSIGHHFSLGNVANADGYVDQLCPSRNIIICGRPNNPMAGWK